MKFGINMFLWTSNFGSEDFALLPAIKEHGFDSIEVTLIRPENFEASAIRRALGEQELSCTVCSVLPSDLSLISDAGTRNRTVAHLSDCIKLTAEVGAKLIAGPLYAPVGFLPGRRRTTEEWKQTVAGYQELGLVLEANGVELCIEPLNRFETYFLNLSSDAAALCDAVGHPKVGVLWDTFHANLEEKHLGESIRAAGEYIKHVHTCENDRGIPGTGHVAWPSVFQALQELEYDGWLTIESFGFTSGDLASAASIWRNLADTPEQIAWQGLEFLKQESAAHQTAKLNSLRKEA
jgi:D-psicose/D-tagatose/L-ribulose 3-epimerase